MLGIGGSRRAKPSHVRSCGGMPKLVPAGLQPSGTLQLAPHEGRESTADQRGQNYSAKTEDGVRRLTYIGSRERHDGEVERDREPHYRDGLRLKAARRVVRDER